MHGLQAHLEHNQQLVDKLQQQLSDAMTQQQALRRSFQQLEAVSDTGRAAKAEARCGVFQFLALVLLLVTALIKKCPASHAT